MEARRADGGAFCSRIGRVCGAVLLAAGVAAGEDGKVVSDLQKENRELKKRVERLESALERVQGILDKQTGQKPSQKAVDEAVDKAIARLEGEKAKPAIRSKYPIDLYGYIKLDASYDTTRVNDGNWVRWVESEEGHYHDDEFNMTARQSRFGLNFNGPAGHGMETTGQVEIDFYGGGGENRNLLFLRHAYFQVDWPKHDFSLLAGQTWDVVSPLLPSTLNYFVLWCAGNPGYRRPQIRLTKGIRMGDTRLLFQAAAARPIGQPSWLVWDDDYTGENSGVPHFQWRTAYSFPLLTKRPTTIGVSGVWGKEEWDGADSDPIYGLRRVPRRNYDTWMICADVTVPLHDKITFKGEVWSGKNLRAYLAGIGQGINEEYERGIKATGGWGALAFGPFDKWRFNVGAGIDDPKDHDISDGSVTRIWWDSAQWQEKVSNRCIFGNVLYDLNEAVRIGFEVSHWDTGYKQIEDGEAWRFQTSFMYRF